MRPLLLPALRRLWRDRCTLQLGVDPDRAVLLAGLDPVTAGILDTLDGRPMEEVCAEAERRGLQRAAVLGLVRALGAAGAVVDAERRSRPAPMPPERRHRLASDAAVLSLSVADPTAVLAARGAATVVVHGGGRIGVPLASLLAAAGVGRVHVPAAGTVTLDDVAPGGLCPADEHRPRATAAADALRRAAPEIDPLAPPARSGAADLVVLADRPAPDPELAAELQTAGVAHLVATVRDGRGVVGPLVLPGRTGCLRCADLHRRDRDPAWPAIAAQLATGAAADPCEVTLAAAVAALAAGQALCTLDGGQPDCLGGSLELRSPNLRVRRRSWPPHPRCGCQLQPLQPTG